MSRVGKQIINIPDGVSIEVNQAVVSVKGPLGQQEFTLFKGIKAVKDDKTLQLFLEQENDSKLNSFYGLARSLVNNMVIGVSTGFEKDLEIVGVGYRAIAQGEKVQLQIGFSHQVIFTPPPGIKIEVPEPTKLKVKGINKQEVGQVAANIRRLRPPEPFKGKGIRYKDEYVRRKAGKTGK